MLLYFEQYCLLCKINTFQAHQIGFLNRNLIFCVIFLRLFQIPQSTFEFKPLPIHRFLAYFVHISSSKCFLNKVKILLGHVICFSNIFERVHMTMTFLL